MQFAAFKAVCDVEVGDEVVRNGFDCVIEDIRTIHYFKSGLVEFEFKLRYKNEPPLPWLSRDEFTYKGK